MPNFGEQQICIYSKTLILCHNKAKIDVINYSCLHKIFIAVLFQNNLFHDSHWRYQIKYGVIRY